VDVGVWIIQLHQQIVQFEPADARLKRAAMIGRIVEFKGFPAAEVELTGHEQDGVAPLLDGEAASVHAPEQFIRGIALGVPGIRGRALA